MRFITTSTLIPRGEFHTMREAYGDQLDDEIEKRFERILEELYHDAVKKIEARPGENFGDEEESA